MDKIIDIEVTQDTEPLKNTRDTWEPPTKNAWSNEVKWDTKPLKNMRCT
jgi:hypothetical protein